MCVWHLREPQLDVTFVLGAEAAQDDDGNVDDDDGSKGCRQVFPEAIDHVRPFRVAADSPTPRIQWN